MFFAIILGFHTIKGRKRIPMTIESRETPLPEGMQGKWHVEDEPGSILIVDGGEITCFGAIIDYDYKQVEVVDGAITVELKVNDVSREDAFSRANINGLVITPDGEFLGYNTKFSVQFLREG